MKANIKVVLRQGILDPQGKAVLHAIRDLGYNNITDVRIGKYIEIELAQNNSKKMKQELEEICKKLLSNPVMENYEVEYKE